MKLKNLFSISVALLIALKLAISPALAEEVDFASLFAEEKTFLKVDDAFKLSTEIQGDSIIARFEIADEYYLYRGPFAFSAEGATLSAASLPDGKHKVDEYLGEVEVYYHNLEIRIPFSAHQQAFTFVLTFQGCAPGLCYPPEEKSIQLYADKVVAKTAAAELTPKAQTNTPASKVPAQTEQNEAFIPEQEKVLNFLSDKSLFEIILYFVLLGIGLAFTPCVLPMVPILSSIIVGQGENKSSAKAFGLSLAYTQSMAIPYTIMGVLVGAAGGSLSNTLQEPIFIGIAAAVFVLLSLSMFGFYELQLPQGLQNRLNHISNSQQGGSYLGAGIMGAISALVVSPCVTVPLAGVLIYIAQTGDQLIGGVALYSLALGMGIPLLLVGVGGNKLLPKSGGWMNAVKSVFGVVMLMMALYIAKHLIPGPLYLAAWAVLLMVSAIYMGALASTETNMQKLWKGLGLVLLAYGVILLIGAALGNNRLLSPLANLNVTQNSSTAEKVDLHGDFIKIKSIEDVEQKLALAKAQGKTLMLDFFAESCTACYEFADYTFPDPKVKKALKNTIQLQADVTANDAKDKALMAHFDVRGLPSILFFDLQGNENKRLRAVGYENAETFARRIKAAFGK